MASDEPSSKKAPTLLRIKLRYEDVDTFVERFAVNIGRSGLFIRSRTPKPVGSEVRFELRLADESPVVIGLGTVRWVKDYDPRRPRALHGMGVEFGRVTRESREVLLRVLEHRRKVGLVDGPGGIPVPPDDDPGEPRVRPSPALDEGPTVVAPAEVIADAVAADDGGRSDDQVTAIRPAPTRPGSASEPPPRAARESGSIVTSAPRPAPVDVAPRPRRATGTLPPPAPGSRERSASRPPLAAPDPAVVAAPMAPIETEPSTTIARPAPLPPREPRRPRPSAADIVAQAATAAPTDSATLAFLEDGLDVATTLRRARSLAGADPDRELRALLDSAAAPLPITIDDASARLAALVGGPAVSARRTRTGRTSAPPIVADGTQESRAVSADRHAFADDIAAAAQREEPTPVPPAPTAPDRAEAIAADGPTAIRPVQSGFVAPHDPVAETTVITPAPVLADDFREDFPDDLDEGATRAVRIAAAPVVIEETSGEGETSPGTGIAIPDERARRNSPPGISTLPGISGLPAVPPPRSQRRSSLPGMPEPTPASPPRPDEEPTQMIAQPRTQRRSDPPPVPPTPSTATPVPFPAHREAPSAAADMWDLAPARQTSSGSIDITDLVSRLEEQGAGAIHDPQLNATFGEPHAPHASQARDSGELVRSLDADALGADDIASDRFDGLGRRRPPDSRPPDLASFAEPPEDLPLPKPRPGLARTVPRASLPQNRPAPASRPPQRQTTIDDIEHALDNLDLDALDEPSRPPGPPVAAPPPPRRRAPTDDGEIEIDIDLDGLDD